jgi:hypothetical protein
MSGHLRRSEKETTLTMKRKKRGRPIIAFMDKSVKGVQVESKYFYFQQQYI